MDRKYFGFGKREMDQAPEKVSWLITCEGGRYDGFAAKLKLEEGREPAEEIRLWRDDEARETMVTFPQAYGNITGPSVRYVRVKCDAPIAEYKLDDLRLDDELRAIARAEDLVVSRG